jgi:hypothetical protein
MGSYYSFLRNVRGTIDAMEIIGGFVPIRVEVRQSDVAVFPCRMEVVLEGRLHEVVDDFSVEGVVHRVGIFMSLAP